MKSMEDIRTRLGAVGESNTRKRKIYTLKGVFTAMARQIENNISRVQLWLQIAMTLFTIGCVIFPWTYNQLVEKGREQERLEQQKKSMESLSNELKDLKNSIEAPKTTEQEADAPKPKPRKVPPQNAKSKRQNLNGQIERQPLANYANARLSL